MHRPVPCALGLLLVCLACQLSVSAASAETFAPPPGKVWHALTRREPDLLLRGPGGQARRRPGQLHPLGRQLRVGDPQGGANQSRLLLHVSTASGQHQPEAISPGAIARGRGDRFLISFGRRLARHGQPVYLRWLGEMNNCDNAYSSRRVRRLAAQLRSLAAELQACLAPSGPDHPGRRRRDNRPQARVARDAAGRHRRPTLPAPQVAFIWSPMTGGSPMIPALRPGVFWPERSTSTGSGRASTPSIRTSGS